MTTTTLNINENRAAKKYTSREMMARFLWDLVSILFRYSPRTFFGWRNLLLRLFGAKIGKEVNIYNTATIYMPWNLKIGDWSSIGEYAFIYNLGKIEIGSKTTVSHRAHLCAGTHDYTNPTLPLLKTPIHIGDHVWICTDSFIGPGVNIWDGAVVGARSVVIKDVESWTIVVGNPAMKIKDRVLMDVEK